MSLEGSYIEIYMRKKKSLAYRQNLSFKLS